MICSFSVAIPHYILTPQACQGTMKIFSIPAASIIIGFDHKIETGHNAEEPENDPKKRLVAYLDKDDREAKEKEKGEPGLDRIIHFSRNRDKRYN